MTDEQVFQQVAGILGMAGVEFTIDQSNQTFLVRSGSARVIVSFWDKGESTVVSLRAYLLQEVDSSDERRLKILEVLNERNKSVPFGCFYFDSEAGVVIVDHQLLGDQLQAPEVLNVLHVFRGISDAADDELREAIGSGVRATDLFDAAEEAASEPAGADAGTVIAT